ncbi:MAG: type II secretion system protein [Verrucomicrobiales bacterium]|jgi:prepilin-type N-terminal cleavage/methylation domain-containing protein|nr:type II secretion system protein [Verrucomicrobiales bacterium]MBP9226426.1 type II secretion system protein [Verrucomicrobiales bacterium]
MNLSITPRSERGFSLVEMSLVIALMLALASIVTFSVSTVTEWKAGRDGAEKLRAVYISQKSFLADQPSKSIATFTPGELIPYLPGNPGAMPSAVTKAGQALTINVQVMPPVFRIGDTVYDPSETRSDGIWDVGAL